MTTLELIHSFEDQTRYNIFLIHKPRTKTEILVDNAKSAISSLNIPNFSPDSITKGTVKASASTARNLGMYDYLLVNHGLSFSIRKKPKNLLLETSLTSRSVTFLPSHTLDKYFSIQSNSNSIKLYHVFIVKTRDIRDYLTFEKLAKNSHLIPTFNNELWKQLTFIKKILQIENPR